MQEFHVTYKTTAQMRFQLVNDAKQVWSLDSVTQIWFGIKAATTDDAPLLQFDTVSDPTVIAKVGGASDYITLTLTATHWNSLPPGVYVAEIVLLEAAKHYRSDRFAFVVDPKIVSAP